MCVIAGYIGNKQAAPILLEMLQREEGLGGAYYSGIATIHKGKLHYAKAVGGACFDRDGSITIEPFRTTPIPIGPFPSPTSIESAIQPLLHNKEAPTLGALCDAVKPLWPQGTLNEKAIAIYETLASMIAEDRIKLKDIRVPGVNDKTTVPQTRIHYLES